MRSSISVYARPILSTMVLAAIVSVVVSAVASASPLLSGYGGPGAGNQALIGSTLLGGTGGSGGGPGAQSNEASGAVRDEQHPGGSGSSGSGSSSTGVGSGRRGNRAADGTGTSRAHEGQVGKSSSSAARAYPTSSSGRATDKGAVASVAFGLSGEDVLYILLVLVGLALTIALTRRLTRVTVIGGGSALKGTRSGPE